MGERALLSITVRKVLMSWISDNLDCVRVLFWLDSARCHYKAPVSEARTRFLREMEIEFVDREHQTSNWFVIDLQLELALWSTHRWFVLIARGLAGGPSRFKYESREINHLPKTSSLFFTLIIYASYVVHHMTSYSWYPILVPTRWLVNQSRLVIWHEHEVGTLKISMCRPICSDHERSRWFSYCCRHCDLVLFDGWLERLVRFWTCLSARHSLIGLLHSSMRIIWLTATFRYL